MPGFIGYQTIDLAFIRIAGIGKTKTQESHTHIYGDVLGKIMYDWLCYNDIQIFEDNKSIIKENYYNNFASEHVINFIQRLEKIMVLYRTWLIFGQWSDPLPAIRYDETYFGSTRDRTGVMKGLKVKEYEFLVIDKEALTGDRLLEITAYYNIVGTNLSIVNGSLENNNRYSYMSKKNNTFKKWLDSSIPITMFLQPNLREQMVYNLRSKGKAPKSPSP
jgi:hypothetical protein